MTNLSEKLQGWRKGLRVADPRAFPLQLQLRPFVNHEQPPARPDFPGAEKALRARVEDSVNREQPMDGWERNAGLLAGLAVLVLFGAVFLPLGIVLAVIAWPTAKAVADARWRARVRAAIEQRFQVEWGAARGQLEAEHMEAVRNFHAREPASRQAWEARERTRVARAKRLMVGDAEAIHDATSEAIDAIDFPFDTACNVAVDDEDHILVDIDLPEIEDVISETQYKMLKSGNLKETKRKVSDRNAEYAELVCGIALVVGATALSASPTLQFVTVAGRTQRQKRASVEIEDTYVLEVKLARDVFERLNAAELDPVELLSTLPSRMQVMANGGLKKIVAPAWAESADV